MTQLFGRRISLVVGKSGEGVTPKSVDLSELHIRFRVVSASVPTPKYAEVRIWNLAQDVVNEILKEFTDISLSVGYGDDEGIIFQGSIARIAAGRENAVDSFVDILAQDGDVGYNWSITNKSLDDGWTDDDVYRHLMQDFASNGLIAGNKPDFTLTPAPRGSSLYGRTSDLMTQLAKRQGCDWFIEDGRVNLVKHKEFMESSNVPTLTPTSGLIGVPTVTYQGIQAQCLMNPMVKVGAIVKIDNSVINRLVKRESIIGLDQVSATPGTLNGDVNGKGAYKAYCVTHVGDSRGNDWYTSFIGIAVDGTIPIGSPALLSPIPSGN